MKHLFKVTLRMDELESSREIIIPEDLKIEFDMYLGELKEYEVDMLFNRQVACLPPSKITKFTSI